MLVSPNFPRLCRFLTPLILTAAAISVVSPARAIERWWPHQKSGKEILVINSESLKHPGAGPEDYLGHGTPLAMLVESLSGLAAQSVNEGTGDQLIWVAPRGKVSYAEWLERLTKRTGMEKKPVEDIWSVVGDFKSKGIVKGYILFSEEKKFRDDRKLPDKKDPGDPVDESSNVATVMAGLLKGVLIEESLEEQAKAAGLELLFDARGVTEAEVFAKHKDQLNRRALLVQSPDFPYGRDYAITHRMMVTFGVDDPTPEIYRWLQPIATVFGWNVGDERDAVLQTTLQGHILIPADWACNLPALSAGTPESLAEIDVQKFKEPVPVKSDPAKPNVSLVMSDGDNVQWMVTSFTHNPIYWGHSKRNDLPIGWGLPLADLIQMAPDIYDYLVETQGDHTSILNHIGYYYPDNFGEARGPAERKKLLAELGDRAEWTFQKTGTHFLTFLINEMDNPGGEEAYQILADAAPSMRGMFSVAYNPYEGGEGVIYWVTRKDGSKVPMSSAAYALWKTNSPERPRAGEPARLAEKVATFADPKKPEWIILHVWSDFAEEGAPKTAERAVGVAPTLQLAKELADHDIGIITLEQLVDQMNAEQSAPR